VSEAGGVSAGAVVPGVAPASPAVAPGVVVVSPGAVSVVGAAVVPGVVVVLVSLVPGWFSCLPQAASMAVAIQSGISNLVLIRPPELKSNCTVRGE
jgi:hypothetical protein